MDEIRIMNERIQQLAMQAGLYVYTYKGTAYPSALSAEECETAYNKFAELIVRECVHVTDTLDEAYSSPSTAGKLIKEHFGVAE